MFCMAVVTVVASLVAALGIPFTAAGAPLAPGREASEQAKGKNLYFAYKVKITNGVK